MCAAALRVTEDQLHAFWLSRQRLLAPSHEPVADLLRGAGWLPSAGGQGAYLALRARRPDLTREQMDRAVIVAREAVEVATVRGVTMIVDAHDAAFAVRAGQRSDDDRYARTRKACGFTDAEIDRLGRAALDALAGGPLAGDGLRGAIPAKLVRSLGEAGKKLGDATTLSIALRRLAGRGEVQRLPAGERLDGARYVWARCDPPLVMRAHLSDDDLAMAVAVRFFSWAGPSLRADLAAFAGSGQTQAKAAIALAQLVRVEVEGRDEELWMHAGDGPTLASMEGAVDRVVFLPFRDNHVYLRRELLDDPLVAGHHAILAAGRLIGIWEWEPAERRVVWGAREKLSAARKKAVAAEAEALGAFIRDELGDVTFYALDNEKNRNKRLAAVRAL
jgi:hypothetical protein